MNILIVEPDKLLARNLAKRFESKGHSVNFAVSAQHALDALDQNSPDCIVLEIQLGLHNGVEYLYEIRSHADWQQIPVIVYTSNRDVLSSEYLPGWQTLGVAELLYKPETSFDKLHGLVQQAA